MYFESFKVQKSRLKALTSNSRIVDMAIIIYNGIGVHFVHLIYYNSSAPLLARSNSQERDVYCG